MDAAIFFLNMQSYMKIQYMRQKKQDLYNSNKFDSLEIFVLKTFYFST